MAWTLGAYDRELHDSRELTLDGGESLLGDARGERVDHQDRGLHESRMPGRATLAQAQRLE